MKYRRMLFLAPAVAATLLGLACSQAEVHPSQLGDCLDPVKCNPPASGDGSTSKDGAAQDAKPASDAASDAAVDSGNASDAAPDVAPDVDAD